MEKLETSISKKTGTKDWLAKLTNFYNNWIVSMGGTMLYIRIDSITNEFVVESHENEYPVEKLRFMGTINGAIKLKTWLLENWDGEVTMSNDVNHPDKFSGFEKHSIDIVAGNYDGVIDFLVSLIRKIKMPYRLFKYVNWKQVSAKKPA